MKKNLPLKISEKPRLLIKLIVISILLLQSCSKEYKISNDAFSLTVSLDRKGVSVLLSNNEIPVKMAEGRYIYRAQLRGAADTSAVLKKPTITAGDQSITVRGMLEGVHVEQTFTMPEGQRYFEEHIVLTGKGDSTISFGELELGFPMKAGEFADDRIAAVPFRHRADDKNGVINDFSITELMQTKGWEYRPNFCLTRYLHVGSRHHFSEGWAWTHDNNTIGIFSFNQENLIYSVLSPVVTPDGDYLRFGGACFLPIHAQPSAVMRIRPGESIDMGTTRYVSLTGGYNEAGYAYRDMLDEKGCGLPEGFNPPIHWEQLYDMEGAWNERIKNYTLHVIEKEAKKGVDYSCESLYLDPGWDTSFGSFLWGEDWLGSRKEFVEMIRSKYGLRVSLHTPMPPWSTIRGWEMGPNCVSAWPAGSLRMPPPESLNDTLRKGPEICMGSKAFLDEAEKRLLANCEDGVTFLMYDGTGWNGPCNDPSHGHPVPYLQEDHIRNCIDLVQRVHRKYPEVLIELHDMLDGGNTRRMTPVYYKYGLPHSYDENWGFELMWNPMDDIRQGRGLAMYYYNLACNIPLYLHIDLRKDNKNCVMLWWFASTARHLGIGGTHKDPEVAAAQREAMKYYRKNDRFFKRGDFYGISEEIHLHVIPGEYAMVVNMFNLSDSTRVINGKFDLKKAGLPATIKMISSEPWANVNDDILEVKLEMAPWSAKVADLSAASVPASEIK